MTVRHCPYVRLSRGDVCVRADQIADPGVATKKIPKKQLRHTEQTQSLQQAYAVTYLASDHVVSFVGFFSWLL